MLKTLLKITAFTYNQFNYKVHYPLMRMAAKAIKDIDQEVGEMMEASLKAVTDCDMTPSELVIAGFCWNVRRQYLAGAQKGLKYFGYPSLNKWADEYESYIMMAMLNKQTSVDRIVRDITHNTFNIH